MNFREIKQIRLNGNDMTQVNYEGTILWSKSTPRPTRLKYLTVSDGQYVDTNVKPTMNTKIEMKVALRYKQTYGSSSPETNAQVLFGSRRGFQDDEFSLWVDYGSTGYGNGYNVYSIGSTNTAPSTHRPKYPAWNTPCVINFQNGRYTLNYNDTAGEDTTDEYDISTQASTLSSNAYSLYLFNMHSDEGKTMWVNGDWYYTKIWENDTLIRNFIPMLDENEVPCLYDEVSKTYYYNIGTGTFGYETL